MTNRVRKLLGFGYVSFLVLWLFGSIILLVKQALAGQLLVSVHDNLLVVADFTQFYSYGRTALSAPHSIYDLDVQLSVFNSLIAPVARAGYFVVLYPPFFILLAALLALLPLSVSYFIWCASSAAVGLLCLRAVLRQGALLQRRDCRLFLLAACVFLPSWMTLHVGQVGWWMLACYCGYYLSWRKRNDIAAGALLALSTFKLQYSVFLAIPALACSRWKLLATAFVSEILLLGAAALAFGWDCVLKYPAFLMRVGWNSKLVPTEKMINLRSLLAVVLPAKWAFIASICVMLVSAVLIVWLWRSAEFRKPRLIPWAMALTTLFAVLVNPHVYLNDLILLVLSAALTLPTVSSIAAWKLEPPSLKVWTSLLLMYPIIGCLMLIYWDVFDGWYATNFDPFPLFDFILLISGLIYFYRSKEQPLLADAASA